MPRTPEHKVHPQFIERWSSRAMSGEPLERERLLELFEAARWAPSSGNSQPWRFAYALARTAPFEEFFSLLDDGNKGWCARAGALVIVASLNTSERGTPLRTHSFDTGAAWMSLALQGSLLGLVVHGMAGFSYDRARAVAGLKEEESVEAMIAIGTPGRLEELSEKDRARESPNTRVAVASFAHEGRLR